MEWVRLNPDRFKGFFTRMMRDTEFRMFYKTMYDSLRLTYRRIFDVIAPTIIKVELALNKSVLNSLGQEYRLLEKSEKETVIRKARFQWLTGLSEDWTFQEQAKWKEGLPELSTWQRRRSGQKRSYSKVKKPGKNQRKRIKLSDQVKLSDPPVLVLVEPVPGPSSVRSRESARKRIKGAGRVLTYDEVIEVKDPVAFPDELYFRFDVPEDVEAIQLV